MRSKLISSAKKCTGGFDSAIKLDLELLGVKAGLISVDPLGVRTCEEVEDAVLDLNNVPSGRSGVEFTEAG